MIRLARVALLVPLLLLAACGFHLRGVGTVSTFPFNKLRVVTPAGGLGDVVQRQLALQPGIKLVPAGQEEAVLTIEKEKIDKQILSVNNSGFVTEYLLVLHARFRLEIGKQEWIAPTQILLRRNYAFDPSNPLGTDAEEALLDNDMRMDAAQQILHRLSAVKKPMETETTDDNAANLQPSATPVVNP